MPVSRSISVPPWCCGTGQGPYARAGRPGGRGLPGRAAPTSTRTPPRWWRTVASPRRWRRRRGVAPVRAEELRAARRAAAGRRRPWPICNAPSDGTMISGDDALLDREVMAVLVAGHDRRTRAGAVDRERTRSSRPVTAPMSCSRCPAPMRPKGFRRCRDHLNGGLPLHPSIAALVNGLRLRLPIIATTLGTFETASAVASTRGPGHGDVAAQDRHRAGS